MTAATQGGDLFSRVFPGEDYTLIFEPTEQQSAAITALVTKRADADESETLLQMLGILPSESAINPTGRDTWAKKPSRVPEKRPNVAVAANGTTECKEGHLRADYSFLDRHGHIRCRKCHAISGKASRERRAAKARTEAAAA